MNKRFLLLLVFSLFFANINFAQDSTSCHGATFRVSTDIVSSYFWRGLTAAGSDGSISPQIQPTLALGIGKLEIGAWGSTDFGGKYKEVDLYASFAFGKSLSLTLSDFNYKFGAKNRYFNYKSKETGHLFEASMVFRGTEKIPVCLTVGTFFYGADKKWNKNIDNGDGTFGSYDLSTQNYSTYIELGYNFKKCFVFCGMTPSDGYYGDFYGGVGGFAVVNVGLSTSKTIQITDFQIPVKATLAFNPQAETAFLVFGITLK